MTPGEGGQRLPKELGLFDVYAICTGAMFSSGFFLLPGLAAAQTGASVPLAYVVAGLFILPPALCVAELATAMPRAGGAYYFLDRSLGPWVGTVGGLGTWIALVFKSAFALVGMGAYLRIYFDVPIQPLAVALTLVFMVVNIAGAKETSGLQRWLVGTLLGVMLLFVFTGLAEAWGGDSRAFAGDRFGTFFSAGIGGFMATVGFVFVSYAGLTKVASVSEEVVDPDRNIPLGMMLSLGTAAVVYGVGVYILVAVLPPDQLQNDLTPVATAASAIPGLAGAVGVGLIVLAALAAFASTGNAGILSASRYPLAMARDRLVPASFGVLGRSRTPVVGIVVTAGLMVMTILLLPVEDIAKLASAFQLLLFSLLSLAVVIMRESGIDGYDPGYRSPAYPWLHVVGMVAPLWLIAQMGQLSILFTLGLLTVTTVWYLRYAAPRVERSGAIFHAFARLGRLRTPALDTELRYIVKEKGLREGDQFREMVARAGVMDVKEPVDFDTLLMAAAERLEVATGLRAPDLLRGFREELDAGFLPMGRGVALPHLRLAGLARPTMLLTRTQRGITARSVAGRSDPDGLDEVRAVLFILSPEDSPGHHLRLLGHLATVAEEEGFLDRWNGARGNAELRAALFTGERLLTLRAGAEGWAAGWVGHSIRTLDLPEGTLIVAVRRGERTIVPRGDTTIEAGDTITVIGTAADISGLEVELAAAPGESAVSLAGRPGP